MFNECWKEQLTFFFAKDKGLQVLLFMIGNCSESVWIGRACMISASFPRDIVKMHVCIEILCISYGCKGN